MNKIKELFNIAILNYKISELAQATNYWRAIVKRQDKALKQYRELYDKMEEKNNDGMQ